jgi:hypothetical protein
LLAARVFGNPRRLRAEAYLELDAALEDGPQSDEFAGIGGRASIAKLP